MALALLAAAPAALIAASALGQERAGIAHSIELSGTVDPASARWLDSALDDATDEGAELVIVRLDTPGGLDTSMRSMVRAIGAAPMPVVVYVAPNGARAASAGLFLVQAADVAAMAPSTNIGAATPVQIGPGDDDEVLGRKIENDAAAYVRALAEGHGRDAELAERMVREGVSVTSGRAADAGLIDVVAENEEELLRRLDGFELAGPKATTLNTTGLRIERQDTPLQYEVMKLLVNPTVASLLLLVGIVGIAIELFNPGGIAPGVLGGIALVLGLYGTAQLPVTAAGVLLLLLALALIAAETQVASGGVLGVGGVAALIAGLLLLYDTGSDVFRVSAPAAVAAGALLGGLTLVAVSKGLAARHRPAASGREHLVGHLGTVRTPLDPEGQVFTAGALWRARTSDPDTVAAAGETVQICAVEGLTLTVEPVPDLNEQGERT